MTEPATFEVRKQYARIVMAKAIAKGTLIRPSQCSQCGSEQRIDGHHPNYSQPLLVEWLCRRCHRQKHGHTHVPGTHLRLLRTAHKGDRQLIQRFLSMHTLDLWLAAARHADERGVSLVSIMAEALARYLESGTERG
jgi:hypothetical protein